VLGSPAGVQQARSGHQRRGLRDTELWSVAAHCILEQTTFFEHRRAGPAVAMEASMHSIGSVYMTMRSKRGTCDAQAGRRKRL